MEDFTLLQPMDSREWRCCQSVAVRMASYSCNVGAVDAGS